LSKGEYVNWLDSDDIFSKDKICSQILLDDNTVDVFTCSWGRFSDLNTFQIKNIKIYKDYKKGVELISDYGNYNTYLPSHSFLVKRKIIMKTGLWNENLKINQDGEFFCRVLINSNNIKFSKSGYVLYRFTAENNVSSIESEEKAQHAIISWKMIENYLLLIDNQDFDKYILNAKSIMYKVINTKFSWVIQEHRLFFENEIRNNKFLIKLSKSLWRKIISYL
jgi:hypothetical protein